MLPGEQCLSVISPDQGLLLCPAGASAASSTSGSAGSASATGGGGGLEGGGFAMAHDGAGTGGRPVYLQLTNFRIIIKFINEEQHQLSAPYSAVSEITAETLTGSAVKVAGALFLRSGASSGGAGGGGAAGSGTPASQSAMSAAAGQVMRFFGSLAPNIGSRGGSNNNNNTASTAAASALSVSRARAQTATVASPAFGASSTAAPTAAFSQPGNDGNDGGGDVGTPAPAAASDSGFDRMLDEEDPSYCVLQDAEFNPHAAAAAQQTEQQQQQQQPSTSIHADPLSPCGGGGGGLLASAAAHLSALSRQPIRSVRILTSHGWSWLLVDPAAATSVLPPVGGASAVLEPTFLGAAAADDAQQQQQQESAVQLRGLSRLVGEIAQIMPLLAQAPELFATVSCAAAARQQQQQQIKSAAADGDGGSGTAAPTGTAAAVITHEHLVGHHIYNARTDLERMLGAAYFRCVSLCNQQQQASGGSVSNTSSGARKLQQRAEILAAAASHAHGHFAVQRLDHASKRFATYPLEVIVPSNCDARLLLEASHCRSNGRVPVVSWLCPHRRVVLARSSQPLVTGQWNADSDVRLVSAIRTAFSTSSSAGASATAQPPQLVVYDFRSRQAATANLAVGGGYETQSRYGNDIDCVFLDLPNIHAVIAEFEKLRAHAAAGQRCALGKEHPLFYAAKQVLPDEESGPVIGGGGGPGGWIKLRRKVIRASCEVAKALEAGRSVLAHCTDGWDRTPQVVSLAKILLDGHFRTVEGFCELIDREWLQFGHRFADRNVQPVPGQISSSAVAAATYTAFVAQQKTLASSQQQQQQQQPSCELPDGEGWWRYADCGEHGEGDRPKTSPIFFQFLDAVRELVDMFPSRFEYTAEFLMTFLAASYSAEYGTFLCNTHRQRVHPVSGVAHRTLSFWAELSRAVEQEVLMRGDSSPSAASESSSSQQQQQLSAASWRIAETPGLFDQPLVNPVFRPALRARLLARSAAIAKQRLARQPSGDGEGGGGPAAAAPQLLPLLFGNTFHAYLADPCTFLSPVDQDGSVLVPVFDAFGGGRAVWSSWLSIPPRWAQFNKSFYSCVTASTAVSAHSVSEHVAAAMAATASTSQQASGGVVLPVLRLFPEAEANLQHFRSLLHTASSSSSHHAQLLLGSPQAAHFHHHHQQQQPQFATGPVSPSAPLPPLAAQFGGAVQPEFLSAAAASSAAAGGGGGGGGSSRGSTPRANVSPSLGPASPPQFPPPAQQQQQQQSPPAEVYLPLRERQDADSCSGCTKTFNFVNRRHTCRSCCLSFCSSCCSKSAVVHPGLVRDRETREALVKQPAQAVRLCNECFFTLSD